MLLENAVTINLVPAGNKFLSRAFFLGLNFEGASVKMKHNTGARREADLPVRLDNAHAQIASKLRALYLSVQEEAIPDRFIDLLEKLDAVERQSLPDVAE